jgi:membrane protease subunit HflC
MVGFSGMYTLNEKEQAVITMYGKVIGKPVTTAGLHFKMPVMHSAHIFPKNILEWDGDPGQFPTGDRRYLLIDTFGRWKIIDPIKFMTSVGTVDSAMRRISDVLNASTKDVVAKHNLIEMVRDTNRAMDTFASLDSETEHIPTVELGRGKLMGMILIEANKGCQKFGIELSDVKAKRVKYIDSVVEKVYQKMSKERESVAAKLLSEGEGEKARIVGDMNQELQEITSGADLEAKRILGAARGKATKTLAKVSMDPEFYEFWQTLKLYKAGIGKGDAMYLSSDNPLLRLMNNGPN